MTRDPVRAIADAVLYEGYLLWPYRHSALKNQRRWTFGGVYPRAHSERHPDDRWVMRAECLLDARDEARVEVAVRFLQPIGEQAVEREIATGPVGVADLLAGREAVIDVRPLEGTLDVRAERAGPELLRVAVEVRNTSPWDGGDREDALRQTFCSTHAVLRVDGGAWVSATDPPESLRDAVRACRNDGVWPVLVGEPGDRHTMLASPIILEDWPRVAPESPGDLFDGGEVDELLVLNILALTDAEKAEMRAADPRAREILERTEALTEEQIARLHGTFRR
jgi:hypothetical protein